MDTAEKEQLGAFVRGIVLELFPDAPDPEGTDYDDPVSIIAGRSRGMASALLGDSEMASDVADAVVLYTFAVAAVRWGECPLSQSNPMYSGTLLSEMVSRTGSASRRVSAIADQLRLAPYRAAELSRLGGHVLPDGTVDFVGWERSSRDPAMVRFLASLA